MNKKGFTLIELIVVVCIIGILAAMAVSAVTVSEGSRVGVVTKLSKKGFICKTWEAEAMIGAVTEDQSGSFVPSVWAFTVDQRAVQNVKDAQLAGAKVELVYAQRLRWPCEADTSYMVTAVNPTGAKK